jgi:hypothetical protein
MEAAYSVHSITNLQLIERAVYQFAKWIKEFWKMVPVKLVSPSNIHQSIIKNVFQMIATTYKFWRKMELANSALNLKDHRKMVNTAGLISANLMKKWLKMALVKNARILKE